MASSVLGAVLVGGQSRRMGRAKALIEIDGAPMVDRTAAVLSVGGCRPVVAIGPDHLTGGVATVVDRFPGDGPLGAIITALEHAVLIGADAAFVVACDLPELDAATVAGLLDARSAHHERRLLTIAVADRREPLVAIWSTGCLAPLRICFDAGERSVYRAIDSMAEIVALEVAVDAQRVRNVNTP